MKIALIQTGSWGDNINSTLMFGPIRSKWPDCLLDVYTSTRYASAFHNNPHISNIIEHQADSKEAALHLHHTIPPLIKDNGYDLILVPHPMLNPGNWTSIKSPQLGTNLICAWVRCLEHNDISYTLPLTTTLRLTQAEITKAEAFCWRIPEFNDRPRTLLETWTESGQSQWDYVWTTHVVRKLCGRGEIVIFSRGHDGPDIAPFKTDFPGLFHFTDGLSIRETAHVFNKCQTFFSVSSGLSNACNTDYCKKDIRWFEIINSPAVSSAPLRSEGKTFHYENNLDSLLNVV